MSEEEKRALVHLEKMKEYKTVLAMRWMDGEILLKLINKQQKEIEDLKVIADDIKDHRIVYIDTPEFEENYISKDKIREKIKAFQDVKKEIIKNENKLSRASITYDIVRNDYCEKMLQELLEEN